MEGAVKHLTTLAFNYSMTSNALSSLLQSVPWGQGLMQQEGQPRFGFFKFSART